MADEVALLVDGRRYRGWTSMGVSRAMDACAGTFSLAHTDRWYGQDKPVPIIEGNEAEILLDGETVITGYVDLFRTSFDATNHTLNVQGRDKTGDLADCSAVHDPDEWRGVTVLQLANILCRPFGVTVRAEVDVGEAFAVAKVQQGETVLETIARHCKQRMLLVMPDTGGGLLITRAGARRAETSLVQGVNIKSASGTRDLSQRFSRYTVRAQAGWSADTDGTEEAHIEARASDPGVSRHRPLLLLAETGGTTKAAQDRATWEANTRLGRANEIEVTVVGWRQKLGGALWTPNLLVPVESSWLRMTGGDMLVREVTFGRDLSGGTVTRLALVSPQAYAPEPPTAKSSTGTDNQWAEALDDE